MILLVLKILRATRSRDQGGTSNRREYDWDIPDFDAEIPGNDEIPRMNDEIIQEEFVLDDDANESIFDGIAEAHVPEEEDSQAAKHHWTHDPTEAPLTKRAIRFDVNFRDVSYIVRSIQAQNFLEQICHHGRKQRNRRRSPRTSCCHPRQVERVS
ncbi:hypothetical protein Cantr_05774 [Candida viswanathii]|uniref:Uncharacterized protein n=1 Tax=Candida viswanathii TaxID=5486 RepID=A0A367XTT6_9ASCO|nr:hypothetical protein Cantr_05774 [Candida viswanathii]